MTLAALALGLALAAEPEVDAPSTDSVYQLSAKWTDSSGKATRLRELEGSVVVLAMIYTTCRGACPMLVADVQRLEAALSGGALAKVRFVLVSFDPARDTPKQLQRYAAERGLASPRWKLLTGDEDAVRELAAVLGMRYRPTGTGEFLHSNLITVLDQKGVIAHRQLGLGQDPAAAVRVIESLAK